MARAVCTPASHEPAPAHTHPLSARAKGCICNPLIKGFFERATAMTTTTDLKEFGFRELKMAAEHLQAYCERGQRPP